MGKLASVSFQCGWIPDQQDYSIVVLPNAVRFDSNNSPNVTTIKANVYRVVDGVRSALPVNSSTGAKHWLLFVKGTSAGTTRTPVSSVNASLLADATVARFDLVAKDNVTVSGSTYIYAEADIITSESIAIAHDGTQGAKSANAFFRSKTQPTTPKGGSYDKPWPTTPAGWSNTPPADNANEPKSLWMSTATFETTTTNQQNWSTPVLVADDTDIEFIFTQNDPCSTPDTTHPHPDNESDAGDGWGKNPVGAVWMAIAKKSGGAWEAWNIIKIKGEQGSDAVSYSLVLTPTSVHYDLNSQKYNPASVTCRVMQTKGEDEVTDVTTSLPTGFSLKYVRRSLNDTMLAEIACNGTLSLSTTTTQYDSIDFVLKKGNVVVARETLGIIPSGKNGTNGKNGVYVPPMMLWTDYPDDYQFQAGNVEAGDDHLDYVGVLESDGRVSLFYCVENNLKSEGFDPATDNNKKKTNGYHWFGANAGTYKFLATELLWAAIGQIDFFNSQAIRIGNQSGMVGYFGTPTGTTNGGAIFYSGGDNVSAATFVVYADGSFTATNADIEGRISASTLDLKVSTAGEGAIPNGSLCFNINSIKLPALPTGIVRSIKVYNPLRTRSGPSNLSLAPENSNVKISSNGTLENVTNGTKTFNDYGRNGGVYLELLGINLSGTTIWTVNLISSSN